MNKFRARFGQWASYGGERYSFLYNDPKYANRPSIAVAVNCDRALAESSVGVSNSGPNSFSRSATVWRTDSSVPANNQII